MTNIGALPSETDLIILGAGLAGHTAALQAAESGCQVLLVEKTGSYGGSTVLSSGSFAFAGTEAQRAAGYEDSGETLADDIRSASGNLADPELV
nr:FAD-binding protein [Pseudomonas sp.]